MNEAKSIPAKLIISLIVPLLAVTFGGLMVFGTASAFFYPSIGQSGAETNGPATIYYGLTLVVALMYFFMKQGYKSFELITLAVLSLIYSLTMQKLTPGVFRPIYLYFVPLLVFFLIMWLVLKYIFLNKHVRQIRILLFSLTGAAAFTIAFKIQFLMLRQLTGSDFIQARFFSGLMLFICMGLGLSLADFVIIKMDNKNKPITPIQYVPKSNDDPDDDDEDN